MASPYRWPLAVSTFTLADKLKIAAWTVFNDKYTMGSKVEAFETAMSEYSGMHALMVANGSVANQLVFELWKIKNPDAAPPVVICPAVTWISSITPAMMAGMKVVFCDINLTDFSFDYDQLANLLDTYKDDRVIIWPTALIGYCPDMYRLHQLADRHGNAEVFLDSCENTFSRYTDEVRVDKSILSSAPLTTTSTYFSHQIVSVEGGFLFCQSKADYELARMFRNHGLSRSLPPDNPYRQAIEETNPQVDPAFLFALPGTNLRPTDVHAMFGLADLKRAEEAKAHRQQTFAHYHMLLDLDRYYLPKACRCHVGFCLPIFSREDSGPSMDAIKEALDEEGIESRPIIGGNLLRQPPFKSFGRPEDFRNAEWVHQRGCYVGLHAGVTPRMIRRLTDMLNTL